MCLRIKVAELNTLSDGKGITVIHKCSFVMRWYLLTFRYLSMVSGFSPEVTMGGRPPLACGILSSSSDIEGCRAVVSGVIWIRLLDSARLIQV